MICTRCQKIMVRGTKTSSVVHTTIRTTGQAFLPLYRSWPFLEGSFCYIQFGCCGEFGAFSLVQGCHCNIGILTCCHGIVMHGCRPGLC